MSNSFFFFLFCFSPRGIAVTRLTLFFLMAPCGQTLRTAKTPTLANKAVRTVMINHGFKAVQTTKRDSFETCQKKSLFF